MRVTVKDSASFSMRTTTGEGYVIAQGTLARTGIQVYRAYQLGLDASSGIAPDKVIRLYRPPSEVFDADSLASFENKPITIEHPSVPVTVDNWGSLAKGDVRDVKQVGGFVVATLFIKSREAVSAIDSGKVELSNGYTFKLDMSPGVTDNGQEYDGIQREIRGNHVAIVSAARCGSACRIADFKPDGDLQMTEKITVDGIPLEVSETAAAAIAKVIKARDEAVALYAAADDKLKGVVDAATHAAAIAAKDAEIEALKLDVLTPAQRDVMVADWAALIEDSKKLAPGIETAGKTCAAIRREVVAHVMGADAKAKEAIDVVLAGVALDAAGVDALRQAFKMATLVSAPQDARRVVDDSTKIAAAMVGKAGKVVLVGRDAMLDRQRTLYKTEEE